MEPIDNPPKEVTGAVQTQTESMAFARTRLGVGINEKDRLKLIFKEVEDLEVEIKEKADNIRKKSTIFWWLDLLFNVCIIGGSAAVTLVTAIETDRSIAVIVLGAVMFFFSGLFKYLKLGDKGYHYHQGNFRLHRINQQVRNLLYLFSNYSVEQILTIISNLRTELDEIEMNLYRSDIKGEGEMLLDVEKPHLQSDSEIHIHIETPQDSPYGSPHGTPNGSPHNSPHGSPESPRRKIEMIPQPKTRTKSLNETGNKKIYVRRNNYSDPIIVPKTLPGQ